LNADERRRRVEDLCHAALERDLAARAAFVATACGSDETLRNEVEALLAHAQTAEVFLSTPLGAVSAGALTDDRGMSLLGRTLGAYQIRSRLGSGGMGEVYRAHDSSLGRDVAIKVLPKAFTSDPERLARFEREARVLATLNHPNIGAIYGVEHADGVQALVLELVEGETLASRLQRGPLPFSQALVIAKQVADALEAAHAKGIVHRDLKPANIQLTGDAIAKVLDFGLAKATSDDSDMTVEGTHKGAVLGTAAYMSPEQASGQTVDKRTDLWAFGCVLYEMLTGRRAFEGDSVSETLACVLTNEPDWTLLPRETPAAIRTLLRRCLQRERSQRLDSAAAARLEIQDARTIPNSDVASQRVLSPARWRSARVAWIAAGGFAVFALVAGALRWTPFRGATSNDRPLIRYSIDLGPEAITNPSRVLVSPDGQRLVFSVRGPNGTVLLATRSLDQRNPTVLRGTEGGVDPFFSPDGLQVGFWDMQGHKLKKVSISGGPPMILCEASDENGASWGSDGFIIAALNLGGLYRVPADGGAPQLLTKPDRGGHYFPQILPGGHSVLFTAVQWGNVDGMSVQLLALDSGRATTLVRGGYYGQYLSSALGVGHLLYLRQGTMYAAAFDPAGARLHGQAVPMLDDVADYPATGYGLFAVSQSGAVYYQGGTAVTSASYPLVWLDRTGKTTPLLAKPALYYNPRFSPDGARLAIDLMADGRSDVSIYDLRQDRLSRLDSSGRVTGMPVWAPDSKHVVVASGSSLPAPPSIVWMHADSGESTSLLSSRNYVLPGSFSPDGKRLAYVEQNPETQFDIWILPLDTTDPTHPKPGRPEAFLRTPSNEFWPAFSPDGRWLAYVSDESGYAALYVRPVGADSAGAGAKWQIWGNQGNQVLMPVWSRDGRQIAFLSSPHLLNPSVLPPPNFELDSRLMTVDLAVRDGALVAGTPHVFADVPVRSLPGFSAFDLHPDGRAAVFPGKAVTAEPPAGSVHVNVLLNFSDELRRRVPIGKP
jgi:serine/threonine-protein kinase